MQVVTPEPDAATLDLPASAPRRPAAVVEVSADMRVSRDGPEVGLGFRLPTGDVAEGEPEAARSRGESVRAHSTLKEERLLDEGPKVIIDMGQFGDGAPPPVPAPAEPAAEAAPEPPLADTSAFAPLFTPQPSPAPAARHRVRELPALDGPAVDVEVRPVKPPSLASLMLFVLVALVGGFTAFVSWRNGWAPVWEDPKAAIAVAFAPARPAPAAEAAPAPPAVVEAEAQTGALQVGTLTLEPVRAGRRLQAMVLRGEVVNATNRVQKGIGIEASVALEPGVPLRTRVVPCCDQLPGDEAVAVAQQPQHPHFAPSFDHAAEVRLQPGESRAFTVIFNDLPADAAADELQPVARVKFSEAERPVP